MSVEAFPDSLWFYSPSALMALRRYFRCFETRICASWTQKWWTPMKWNPSAPQITTLLASFFFFPAHHSHWQWLLLHFLPIPSWGEVNANLPWPAGWEHILDDLTSHPSSLWASFRHICVQKALPIKGTWCIDQSWRPHPSHTFSFIRIGNTRSKWVDLPFWGFVRLFVLL